MVRSSVMAGVAVARGGGQGGHDGALHSRTPASRPQWSRSGAPRLPPIAGRPWLRAARCGAWPANGSTTVPGGMASIRFPSRPGFDVGVVMAGAAGRVGLCVGPRCGLPARWGTRRPTPAWSRLNRPRRRTGRRRVASHTQPSSAPGAAGVPNTTAGRSAPQGQDAVVASGGVIVGHRVAGLAAAVFGLVQAMP